MTAADTPNGQITAHVADDFIHNGVKVALVRHVQGATVVREFEGSFRLLTVADEDRELAGTAWLPLSLDEARALYGALADHFGHTSHDMRALRADYAAERGRVDLCLDALLDLSTRHPVPVIPAMITDLPPPPVEPPRFDFRTPTPGDTPWDAPPRTNPPETPSPVSRPESSAPTAG